MSQKMEMPCDESAPEASLGMLLVLSGPSGVGKDTVWQAAAPMLPSFCKAITCTTRKQREHEVEGEHYYFVSNDEFDRLIRANELLEWAEVHGNRYGVPALPVLNRINDGHDVVCVIDVQGASAVRGRFPTSLLIFLRPPADQNGGEEGTLKQRLQGRAPLSDEGLARRLKTAAWELAQTQLYDHAIVNEDVAQTAEQLRDIVLREKETLDTHASGELMHGKTIVLGVTGGIAAYKSCDLASKLTQRGARVKTILTASAQQFVTPLTFQALTQQPVYTSLWPSGHDAQSGVEAAMAHIALANEADAILVAPMSADFGAKLAGGHSDDLLSTVILATRAPILLAPAMNPAMWHHAATQRNLQVLATLGYSILDPESGRMACEHVGVGRLPTTEVLIEALQKQLFPTRDMEGLQVLVTAGPTREMIDPVRFLSNRSSGRMGFAIAEECARRGASASLICGPTNLPTPPNVTRIDIVTATQMNDAVQKLWPQSDILIASAAPADFQAAHIETQKIKKRDGQERLTLELARTPDIVGNAAKTKKVGQTVIGFAAETENLIEHARTKLETKKLDAIVANDVSQSDAGFDVDTNRVTWMTSHNSENWPLMSKKEVAARLCAAIVKLRA